MPSESILGRGYAVNSRCQLSAVGLPRRETKASRQWVFARRRVSARQTVDAPDRLRHPRRKYRPVTRAASRIASSPPVGTPANPTAPKQWGQNCTPQARKNAQEQIQKKLRAARTKTKWGETAHRRRAENGGKLRAECAPKYNGAKIARLGRAKNKIGRKLHAAGAQK